MRLVGSARLSGLILVELSNSPDVNPVKWSAGPDVTCVSEVMTDTEVKYSEKEITLKGQLP